MFKEIVRRFKIFCWRKFGWFDNWHESGFDYKD